MRTVALLSFLLLLPLAACSGGEPPADPPAAADEAGADEATVTAPRDAFWAALESLCGQAFAGRVTESNPPDATDSEPLVMHVRECGSDEIRVPFHIGENRSRTWVFTRTADGLRLKHDHRHEDGSAEDLTDYGGDTRDPGTAERQAFHADAYTAELIPEAVTNIWTVELVPGERWVYHLVREGTERRFRAEFDLSTPVAAPPAPWGS